MRFCTKRIDDMSLAVIKELKQYRESENRLWLFTRQRKHVSSGIIIVIPPNDLLDRIANEEGHSSIRLVFDRKQRCYSSVSVMFAVFTQKLPITDRCETVWSSILVYPILEIQTGSQLGFPGSEYILSSERVMLSSSHKIGVACFCLLTNFMWTWVNLFSWYISRFHPGVLVVFSCFLHTVLLVKDSEHPSVNTDVSYFCSAGLSLVCPPNKRHSWALVSLPPGLVVCAVTMTVLKFKCLARWS